MIFLIVYLRSRSDKVLRGNRNDFGALHFQNLLLVEPKDSPQTTSAYSSGYSAFGTGISTSYVPHEESYSFIRFSKTYIFILISEKEKTKYNNYYIVSDYYIPEDTKSE